jgi:phage replication-related protein YjqB (UPF0714/DUF867 family)
MPKNMTKSGLIEAVTSKLGDGVTKKQVTTVLEVLTEVAHKELHLGDHDGGEGSAVFEDKLLVGAHGQRDGAITKARLMGGRRFDAYQFVQIGLAGTEVAHFRSFGSRDSAVTLEITDRRAKS